jgi:hypothetical protein
MSWGPHPVPYKRKATTVMLRYLSVPAKHNGTAGFRQGLSGRRSRALDSCDRQMNWLPAERAIGLREHLPALTYPLQIGAELERGFFQPIFQQG